MVMSTRRLLIVGLCLLVFAQAATLTWTGGSAGKFTDAVNWNTRTVPTAQDHINILDGADVTLSTDMTVMSMRVGAGAKFTIAANLQYLSGVSIDNNSNVVIQGGSLTTPTSPVMTVPSRDNPTPSVSYPTVTVNGNLQIINGRVAGAAPASSTGAVEFPSVFSIGNSGVVTVSGDTTISNARLMVSGGLRAGSVSGVAPNRLDLDFVGIEASSNAAIALAGTLVQSSNNDSNRASLITLSGSSALELDGSLGNGLSVRVPITVGSAAAVVVRSGTVTMEADLTVNGRAQIQPNAHLRLAATAHNFATGSTTVVNQGATLTTVAGQTTFRGPVNTAATPTGTIVVRAPTDLVGAVYVQDLQLAGGLCSVGTTGQGQQQPVVRVARTLALDSGTLRGQGEGARAVTVERTGAMTVVASTASRAVQSLTLNLLGASNVIDSNAVLVLGRNAIMNVESGAALTMGAGAVLASDGTNTALVVARDGSLVTSVGGTKDTTIEPTLAVDGLWSLVGGSTSASMLVKGTTAVQALSTTSGSSGLTLTINPLVTPANDTPNVALPARIASPSLALVLRNVVATAGSDNAPIDWQLKSLSVAQARLFTTGRTRVTQTLTIGDGSAVGMIVGGEYTAGQLVMAGGTFTPLSARVTGECPAVPVAAATASEAAVVDGFIFPTDVSVTDEAAPITPTDAPAQPPAQPPTESPVVTTPANPTDAVATATTPTDRPGPLAPVSTAADCKTPRVLGMPSDDLAWTLFGVAIGLGVLFLAAAGVAAYHIRKGAHAGSTNTNSAVARGAVPSSVNMATVGGMGAGAVRR